MPYLTDLADAARKSGLKVVEEPGWKSRGHGPMVDVRTIVCHHTAGPTVGNMPSLGVVRDGRTGLRGPLSHLTLARDGTVYVVAAGLCYHAGAVGRTAHSNGYAIGIEAEATGVTSWPAVQMDAYARLCAALATHYDVALSHIVGHKEIATPKGRKIDPNFSMPAFRSRVAAVDLKPKGDRNQKTRRAILAAEKAGALFVAALEKSEKEARAAGQRVVAARLKLRIKSEKAYIGRLGKRRVALRPKKK